MRTGDKKGKYNWKYLGKNTSFIPIKLEELGVQVSYTKDQLDARIRALKKKIVLTDNRKRKSAA